MPSLDSWCDIYDGGEYVTASGKFKYNPACVSFTLNTDGVALYRSSKKSLWPVWLVINELPPSERYKPIYTVHIRTSVCKYGNQNRSIGTILARMHVWTSIALPCLNLPTMQSSDSQNEICYLLVFGMGV